MSVVVLTVLCLFVVDESKAALAMQSIPNPTDEAMRRRFVPTTAAKFAGSDVLLKLIQYNILADGEKLALSEKHSYCPMPLRLWGSVEQGRCFRLLREISSYDASVICLQELMPDPYSRDFLPWLRAQGYCGVHIRDIAGVPPLRPDSMFGNAVFYREREFELVDARGVLYRNLIQKAQFNRKIRDRLTTLDDSVIILLLLHRAANQLVVVANTHLYWDPRWPHVKAIQVSIFMIYTLSLL